MHTASNEIMCRRWCKWALVIAIKKMRTVEDEADILSNDLVEYCVPNIARLWMTARWIEVATCMIKRKCRPRGERAKKQNKTPLRGTLPTSKGTPGPNREVPTFWKKWNPPEISKFICVALTIFVWSGPIPILLSLHCVTLSLWSGEAYKPVKTFTGLRDSRLYRRLYLKMVVK